jgi:hypothetical protein
MESKWKQNCCWCGLFPTAEKSIGRPLPRFMAAPTADAGVYWPMAMPDAIIGADAEIGVALSGRIRLPSGPYFLGRPRFFATLTTAPPPTVGGDTNTPLELPLSAVAAKGGGDWKPTVGAVGGGCAAAAAVDVAAIGPGAALASPDLVASMPAASSRTRPLPQSPRAPATSSRHWSTHTLPPISSTTLNLNPLFLSKKTKFLHPKSPEKYSQKSTPQKNSPTKNKIAATATRGRRSS